jgi:hypothetical protein
MLQKIRFVFFFFDKKDPKPSLLELLSMIACTLFRNNKQYVVLGQKRKCQCMEESGL